MRDFADLESAVQDAGSKRYLHEAVIALSGGANRAALVSLWTAVILDLMSKVSRLADTGDGEAAAVAKKIDRAIESGNPRNMQRVEFELLDNAEKLEILSARQIIELKRVRDDRNLCAHPAFIAKGEVFMPSVELVRSHIATAVDCCLSLPAISGKQVIQLFEDDLASDSWPGTADVISFVRHRYLENVRESTKRNITMIAMKNALAPRRAKSATKVDPHVISYRCRCYINSLMIIDRSLLEECLSSVLDERRKSTALDDECLLRSLGAFGHLREYWGALREDEIIALNGLLSSCDVDWLLEHEVFASGIPMNERVTPSFVMAFGKVLSLNPGIVDELLSSTTAGYGTLIPMVISDLKNAYSFRDAEQRLGRINRFTGYLSAENILEIGQATRSNKQIYEAAGTQTLLINIFEGTKSVPEALKAWKEVATGLNCDYLTRHPEDPDGYYSYSMLLSLVSEAEK